jgi:hypothetical protein
MKIMQEKVITFLIEDIPNTDKNKQPYGFKGDKVEVNTIDGEGYCKVKNLVNKELFTIHKNKTKLN